MSSKTKYRISHPLDDRRGIVTSVITIALIILLLFLVSFEMADPPAADIMVETDTELPEEIDLKELKVETGSGASGDPSDDPIKEPEEQTEQQLSGKSKKNRTTNKGKSNKTNSKQSENEASTAAKSNNPFASGGQKGGEGNGKGFGKDKGNGTGDGPGGRGDGGKRIRLKDPVVDNYQINNIEYIHLKVVIDENGNVISARNLPSKTTILDQRIINQVIQKTIQTAKYNKEPGAAIAEAFITVKIMPQ